MPGLSKAGKMPFASGTRVPSGELWQGLATDPNSREARHKGQRAGLLTAMGAKTMGHFEGAGPKGEFRLRCWTGGMVWRGGGSTSEMLPGSFGAPPASLSPLK